MTPNLRPIDKPTEEWVAKLRYSRSFMAKLILSEPAVKEYYATIATKLLRYDKMRSRMSWNGIQFGVGRKTVAKMTFSGKTLTVYFALDPARYDSGKYRLREAASKRYAATPGKLRITSPRALAYALRLVDDAAALLGLTPSATPMAPISAKDFPTDTMQNLVARGLVRLLKGTPSAHGPAAPAVLNVKPDDGAEIKVTWEGKSVPNDDVADRAAEDEVYRDTLDTTARLTERHAQYVSLVESIRTGTQQVRHTKRKVSSVMDETWVNAIEDCMQALDEVTRNPMHFIEETEELLPIERTKKVTQRSIQHLSQHSGLISRIEGDVIIPSKLLNVFHDDSMMTYENKFVNTLLQRLYDFVEARYETAKEGADKEATALDFDESLDMGDTTGKISLHIELRTPAAGRGKKSLLHTDLWKRITKLHEMVTDYQSSEFVQQMGTAYVRPPVMHTNAILKNKNLRQCLTLWEFIEGYEDTAGMSEDEREYEVDPHYLEHLYRSVATQYLTFCRNAAGLKEVPPCVPQSAEPQAAAETTAIPRAEDEDASLWGIRIALAADLALDEMDKADREARNAARQALLDQARREDEPAPPEAPHSVVDDVPVVMPDEAVAVDWGKTDTAPKPATTPAQADEEGEWREVTTYRKSLQAKLQLADDELKARYVGIYNRLVSHNRVKARLSYEYVSFFVAGKPLARMTVIGKTLRVYYALDPHALENRFGVRDAADVKKYAATPALLYVRGERSYNHALELADRVCEGLDEAKAPAYIRAEDYPRSDVDALVEAGLAQRTVTTVPVGQPFVRSNATPLTLRATKPDADYRKDYRREARKLLAKEKPAPSRTIDLDGLVTPGEVRSVLEEADAQMEQERLSRLRKEAETPTPAVGGDGDALRLRKEALMSVQPDAEAPAVTPQPQPEPAPVPVGGDALTPKPITMEEIDRIISADNPTPDKAVAADEPRTPERKSRLWKRSKKKRK